MDRFAQYCFKGFTFGVGGAVVFVKAISVCSTIDKQIIHGNSNILHSLETFKRRFLVHFIHLKCNYAHVTLKNTIPCYKTCLNLIRISFESKEWQHKHKQQTLFSTAVESFRFLLIAFQQLEFLCCFMLQFVWKCV